MASAPPRAPIDMQQPIANPSWMTPYQAPSPETGFLDNFSVGAREMEIAGNIGSSDNNLVEAYRPILEALDQAGARRSGQTIVGVQQLHYLNPGNLTEDPLTNGYADVPGRSRMRAMIFDEIRRQRQRDPNFLHGVPDNPDDFERQANQRTRAELQSIRETQDSASPIGRLGGFLGGVAGSFQDPVNLATLPIGGAETTFVRQVGRAAIENMIIEAVSQPQVVQNYAALGENQTLADSINSVVMAGVAGGAFHLGMRGTSEVAGRTLGPLYDHLAAGVFNSLPDHLQRAWADSATVGDHLLIDLLHATVPEEHWSPDIRAAVNVVTRDADIAAASPFEPSRAGDEAHGAALADTLRQIVDGAPPTVATAEPRAFVPQISVNAPPVERQWSAIVGGEGGTGAQGQFLVSPRGALGPAQLMPGTAPHAAQLAGLPWDENRYRTDAEYNLTLGRAYYEEQLRTFGDPAMAAAAYNAGPGSARTGRGVRGAIARAEQAGEPGNWRAYLPHETQQYVRDFERRTGMGAQEPSVALPADGQPAAGMFQGWTVIGVPGDPRARTDAAGNRYHVPHNGVDFRPPTNDPHLVADRDFEIVSTQPDHGISGITAIVRFSDGTEFNMMHLAEQPRVGPGHAGDVIATAGRTGNARSGSTQIHVQPWGETHADPRSYFGDHAEAGHVQADVADTGGAADSADIEVRMAQLEQEAARADGGGTVQSADTPALRRDMFADDASYADAQDGIYRQHNDVTEDPFRAGRRDAATMLADAGGIRNDEGHDLVSGRNLPRFAPAGGLLIRPNGMSIDRAGEFLWERGFFGHPSTTERPTVDETLNFIEHVAHNRVFTPEDQAAFAISRAHASSPTEADIWDHIKTDVHEAWGGSMDVLDTPEIRARAVAIHVDPENWRQGESAYGQAIDELSAETIRAIREQTGTAAYDSSFDFGLNATRGNDHAAVARGGRPAGESEASFAGRGPPSRSEISTGALAASLAPSIKDLAQFDEPMGKTALAHTDSLEHDLMAAIEKDPALRERPFIIDAVGESATLNAILDELNADKAAADALRGCL